MLKFLTFVFAVAFIIALTAQANAKTVIWDQGGSVRDRGAQVIEMIERGESARIIGTCASSCTMYLIIPGTCVHKNASVIFHGPITAPENYSAFVYGIAQYYPEPLREWFVTEGHKIETNMPGSRLIEEFGIADCEVSS